MSEMLLLNYIIFNFIFNIIYQYAIHNCRELSLSFLNLYLCKKEKNLNCTNTPQL